MNKTKLTTVILSKNEETRIENAINSVISLGTVIVIDNGSTDDTVKKATALGAKVLVDTASNFSSLRDKGRKEVKTEWILYLDADEILTPALQKEISHVVDSFNPDKDAHGFFIERTNFYLGHKWPTRDKMERLFLARSLTGWSGRLHESPTVKGRVETLREPLIHNTHRTLSEMVEKTNVWSSYEADLRYTAHHPPVVWWRLIRVMITAFWKSFVTEKGYLAGTVGWVESIFQAFSMFITYAKLWEMQQHAKN